MANKYFIPPSGEDFLRADPLRKFVTEHLERHYTRSKIASIDRSSAIIKAIIVTGKPDDHGEITSPTGGNYDRYQKGNAPVCFNHLTKDATGVVANCKERPDDPDCPVDLLLENGELTGLGRFHLRTPESEAIFQLADGGVITDVSVDYLFNANDVTYREANGKQFSGKIEWDKSKINTDTGMVHAVPILPKGVMPVFDRWVMVEWSFVTTRGADPDARIIGRYNPPQALSGEQIEVLKTFLGKPGLPQKLNHEVFQRLKQMLPSVSKIVHPIATWKRGDPPRLRPVLIYRRTKDFKESDHPRKPDGEFGKGGGDSDSESFEVKGKTPASRLSHLKDNIANPHVDGLTVHKEISAVDKLPKKKLEEIGSSLGIDLSSAKNSEDMKIAIKNNIVNAWEKSHSSQSNSEGNKPTQPEADTKKDIKSPLPSDEQKIIDDPSKPLEKRLDAAANADIHTFDKIVNDPSKAEKFQAAGGVNNEYFRNIFNNYRDLKRNTPGPKRLESKLSEMDAKISEAVSGLSAFPELKPVANWYEETWGKLRPEIKSDITDRITASERESQQLRSKTQPPRLNSQTKSFDSGLRRFKSDGRWITVGGAGGEDGGGTHIFIDGEGKIEHGPPRLKGKKIGDISSKKPDQKDNSPKNPETTVDKTEGGSHNTGVETKHTVDKGKNMETTDFTKIQQKFHSQLVKAYPGLSPEKAKELSASVKTTEKGLRDQESGDAATKAAAKEHVEMKFPRPELQPLRSVSDKQREFADTTRKQKIGAIRSRMANLEIHSGESRMHGEDAGHSDKMIQDLASKEAKLAKVTSSSWWLDHKHNDFVEIDGPILDKILQKAK